MKIVYFVIYNGLVYPAIFLTAIIISTFNKKLRQSVIGKFGATKVLKKYFKKIDSNSNIYWFHASSLGEFFQVKTVIERLKEKQDDLICIVSFSSPSGFNHANSDAMDLKFYIPSKFRTQHKSNRQASNKDDLINPQVYPTLSLIRASELLECRVKDCLQTYHDLVSSGVCREQARGVLPQNL